MKRMFSFDPEKYAAEYAAKEYVHIRHGLKPEFLAEARRQVGKNLDTGIMEKFAIGDKQQAMYRFADEEYLREFLETIGAICGLDASRLVVSERHIKAYEADADPKPLAHKDRFATQVAVGFSIEVPAGSTLVLYPRAERDINLFNTSTELRKSLRPDGLPEARLKDATRVEIQDAPGDVMMFRGNSIWHMRERPAGTIMLYFKLNDYHCDPLGEDPRTPQYRACTRALAAAPTEQIIDAVPILGRRVDYIHHRYSRDWSEVTGVVLWGENHLTIDDEELKLLKAIDGERSVRSVVRAVAGGTDDRVLLDKLRQLAQCGIVELLPSAGSNGFHKETIMGAVAEVPAV
jgi:hypothetical protein